MTTTQRTDEARVAETDGTTFSAQRILDASPVPMFVRDVDGPLVAYSRRLPGVLGCSDEQLRTRGADALRERIHPDDKHLITTHEERVKAAQGDEIIEVELRMRGPGDEERWFINRSAVFSRDTDGAAREVLVTLLDWTEQRQHEIQFRREKTLFEAFRTRLPALMYAKDNEGTYILSNPPMEKFLGLPQGSMVGKKDADFFPPEIVALFNQADDHVRASHGLVEAEETTPHPEGGFTSFFSIKFAVEGPEVPEGSIAGMSIDISRVKVAEAERESATKALIAAQQDTILELATPLMPIADGVLAVPLVGEIDIARVGRIVETLLTGITQHHASVVIIDITGVKVVDAEVAEGLLRAARAVALLGARVVLTGIQPSIAQTLVQLGVDWQGLVTEATLQRGIAYALRHRASRG
jgi:anti-anti-sigma regulatory factor/PAS domain-containing protein